MSTFALKKIEEIQGDLEFYKLIQSERCELDEFWEQCKKDGTLSKELNTIQTRLQQLSEGQRMPQEKFKDITPKKNRIKEFELKTKHLRLYMFQEGSMGRIIVIGGKKTTQKADIVRFRRIKERYIQNNIQLC